MTDEQKPEPKPERIDYVNGDLDDDVRADAVRQDAYEHGFDREEE
jgi:hypothetical protein